VSTYARDESVDWYADTGDVGSCELATNSFIWSDHRTNPPPDATQKCDTHRRFNEKAITDVNLIAKKITQACHILGYLQSRIPLVIFGWVPT
jgi:hypothetical protein